MAQSLAVRARNRAAAPDFTLNGLLTVGVSGKEGHVSVPKGHGGPTSITLQPGRQAPRAARRFVHYAAAQWLGQAKLEDVLSVVSELVDNVALHAQTPMVLNLSPTDGDHVRIELYDGSSRPPTPLSPLSGEPAPEVVLPNGGLGLRIVEGMVSRWGVDVLPVGKMVWAEI